MIIERNALWAGTEDSLTSLLAVAEKATDTWLEKVAAGKGDEPAPTKLYSVTENGTAVIAIRGRLLNRDLPDWLCEMVGATTYPSLQRQAAEAAADTSVKRVLLDVNSGGGQVSGVAETAEALVALSKVKPVTTYAGDTMASAAYWLGSVGGNITMSKGGVAGSIGVIGVHYSDKKALEQEGITPTVIRSGVNKHLGHQHEELSAEALASIQKEMDFHHGRFIDAVAEHRGIPRATAALVSDGRCFYGSEAVDVGLVDRIGTFAECLRDFEAQAGKSIVKPSGFAANHGEPLMNLEQAMARITELEGEQEAGKTALAAAETRATEAEQKVAQLEASNEALSTTLASAKVDQEAFGALLDNSINTMAVALGVEVMIPDALKDKQAYHTQIQDKFQARFPAGGVAATGVKADEEASAETLPAWLKLNVR